MFKKTIATVCKALLKPFRPKYPKGRFSTVVEVGVKIKDQGPYYAAGGEPISVTCYVWPDFPEQRYTSINNIEGIPLLNPRYDEGLTPAQRLRVFGPYGCMPEAMARSMYTRRYSTDTILWGIIPERFWYWPAKLFKLLILPQLIWISKNVVIPLPIMYGLRHSAYALAMLLSFVEFMQMAYDLQRKLMPLLNGDKLSKARTLKEFQAAYALKKHGLFMDYENFKPGYKFMYYIYWPVKKIFFALDWYYLQPIWARLTRFGNDIEVKTLTKSRYHKGLKVIVGGTRIRWPGFIGSRDKPEHWLQIFVIDFTRDFLFAFATGNLYVFGWRV